MTTITVPCSAMRNAVPVTLAPGTIIDVTRDRLTAFCAAFPRASYIPTTIGGERVFVDISDLWLALA